MWKEKESSMKSQAKENKGKIEEKNKNRICEVKI